MNITTIMKAILEGTSAIVTGEGVRLESGNATNSSTELVKGRYELANNTMLPKPRTNLANETVILKREDSEVADDTILLKPRELRDDTILLKSRDKGEDTTLL